MGEINYYSLLKDGAEAHPNLDWEEMIREVVNYGKDVDDPDTALEVLYNICFENSELCIGQKTRIVKEAERKHTNPSLLSDYCRTSLRNLVSESSKEADRRRESPEIPPVHRQVCIHLRLLEEERSLKSQMVRSENRKDRYKLWGLSSWGPEWMTRQPGLGLEEFSKDLPTIAAYREGKKVFDYVGILPTYIPDTLAAYGAPLCTSEITSLICCRISPPLVSNPGTPNPDFSLEDFHSNVFPGCQLIASPEDLLVEKQLWNLFENQLNDREMKVYEMSEEGLSIEETARQLNCSSRTVNNDRKSIFEKCRSVLRV
jgi:hypothetical protein